MKRLLAALLLVASPVLAQATNGWAEIANGWGEIQNPPGYDTIPAPTGCASGLVPYFNASLELVCSPTVWNPTTKSLDVTDGRVQAANLRAIGLATPGGITVTPTLSQIGAITAVAGSALADGDALSVGDGTGIVPMEFDAAPGDGTSGGAVAIIFDGTETATEIRDAIKAILDAAGRDWTTSAQGADGIGIVRATPGATGGAITEAVTAAGFLVTDWTDPTHATTVTYQLVACLADGSCTQAGVDSTTGGSTATLSASNFNRLSWSAVTGAASYKVYRKVAPTSPATVGVIYTGTALTVDDTGIAGGGETAPTTNGTGVVTGSAGLRIQSVGVPATAALAAADVSGTLLSNYGQGGANTTTLPAAAAGLNFITIVGTSGAGAWHIKAGASDKLYLDGVALDDGDKASLAAPAVGNTLTCVAFQTGASAWDWICTSGGGATWTDGGA